MKNFVLKCYKEYKKFMKESRLPNIIPVILEDDSSNRTIAYIEFDESRNGDVPIYINKKLFLYDRTYAKSILFHEFTHIYDMNITFFNIEDENKLIKLMASYSEFHASQIELLVSLGYFVISPIYKKFSMNRKIYFESTFEKIDNYLLHPLANSSGILGNNKDAYNTLSAFEYNIKYVTASHQLFCYLGKYDVCVRFGDREPHDFWHEFGEFSPDAKKLYELCKSKNYEELCIEENRFLLHFLNYFENEN